VTEPDSQPDDQRPLVGRLAPSPTGAQHVGNARTYLLAWLSIRARGGRVVFRLEDIDSPRIKAGAAAQAIDDLRWLGLDWDEGPDVGGPQAPYVQTERSGLYQAALDELRRADRIYPCTCTRGDVAAAASAPHVGQEGPRYPGTCAWRTARDADKLREPYCWRLRATSRVRALDDLVAGRQTLNVHRDLGDFVVAKADGTPAYQLAVVVDDHAMQVSEVLRGNDLLPSAFRQLELYEFFGWTPPDFAHVPLVVGTDGRRLAKRHGDTRIARLRQADASPQGLIGWLACSAGLRTTGAPISAAELLNEFTLARLPPDPTILTPAAISELGL
jgi:glutamyl-tRNA synthetase